MGQDGDVQGEHDFVIRVQDGVSHTDEAAIGFAVREAHLDDFRAQAEFIAGSAWAVKSDFVNAQSGNDVKP